MSGPLDSLPARARGPRCLLRKPLATAGISSCRKSAWRARNGSRPAAFCSSAPAVSARRWDCTSPPPASAGSAWSISTWSISATCSGRCCTAPPTSGRPKLHSARDRLQAINPEVRLDLYETRLTSANALSIFEPYDIIIDGTDNFPTRYLVNDACVLLKKPNVYGSIFRFDGQASVFYPGQWPVLSLSVSGAAAARRGAELCRGRRAGHPARPDRLHPGDRGRQAAARPGRAADRPAAALRRPANELPRVQGAAQSEMSRLRRTADHHQTDRLRAILRRARPGGTASRRGRRRRHHGRGAETAAGSAARTCSSSMCAIRRRFRFAVSPAAS